MPKSVLIVEDDPLIAMDMEDFFESRNYDIVGPAFNVVEALELLKEQHPDYATLDYNLGNETSLPIADILYNSEVPFVFVTGRVAEIKRENNLPSAPVLTKPVQYTEILAYFD